jgi:hypothetical protein
MSRADVICSQCGTVARLLSVEGQVFPAQPTERPLLFQIIDCPRCGRREQPDGDDTMDIPPAHKPSVSS